MFFSDLLNDYPPFRGMIEKAKKNITPIHVSGVTESAQGHLIYRLCKAKEASVSVVICYSDMEAKALYHDISFFTGNVYYFPSKEYTFYNIETKAHENEHRRLETLYHMIRERDIIVVMSLDALLEYTVPAALFQNSLLHFAVGERFDK